LYVEPAFVSVRAGTGPLAFAEFEGEGEECRAVASTDEYAALVAAAVMKVEWDETRGGNSDPIMTLAHEWPGDLGGLETGIASRWRSYEERVAIAEWKERVMPKY